MSEDKTKGFELEDDELIEVTGGEYDSKRRASSLYNHYVFGPTGQYVAKTKKKPEAVEIARSCSGFVVAGHCVTFNRMDYPLKYMAENYCLFASDGFIAANPGITPGHNQNK